MSSLILVIEDNDDLSRTIKDFLEDEGCRVVVAGTGAEGFATAAAQRPDAVILDLMLPDQPGLQVCRTLRVDPRTRDVPIVICSGLNRTSDRVAGLQAGADDYVAKPVSLRELSLRVRGCVHRSRRRSAGAAPAELGALCADPSTGRVWVGAVESELELDEFIVLWALLSERDVAVSAERLQARVRGDAAMSLARIEEIVGRLRSKLGGAGGQVEALPDHAYCFRTEPVGD